MCMDFVCVIQPCNATTSSTFMICQTPSLSEYASTSRIQLPVTVEFGFLMDDVQQLRKMSSINSKSFSYIEDPKIIPFGKTNVYKDGMKLTISVSMLHI